MPRVEVSAPATSILPLARAVSGTTTRAAATTARPIGTLTNITQRHENHSVRSPPAMRPIAAPPMETPVKRPSARVRSRGSVKVDMSSASTAGAARAAPTPCAAREATSHVAVVAKPPANDEVANNAIPVTKTRRRPNRSPARAPKSSRPPKASV